MKFLCIECDEAMTMKELSGPDDIGSMAVVYQCGQCGKGTALLTNAHETQLVSSLGVKIGPDGKKDASQSKCPFTKMMAGSSSDSSAAGDSIESEFLWSEEAQQRLQNIPSFIRPMAQSGVESFAREQGLREITLQVLDKARASMGF